VKRTLRAPFQTKNIGVSKMKRRYLADLLLMVGTVSVGVVWGAGTCQAAQIYVNTTADTNGGNVCSLRNALDAARNAHERNLHRGQRI
jgi:CSLREA domain-containing protein